MYAICKTVHPTTEVEHSVYCHFYNFGERNLLTAGGNQLKVYRLVRDPSFSGEEQFEYANFEGVVVPDNVRLECRQTFTLHGTILSVNSVSFAGANRDCIVLTFSEAKVSIVEYDPNTHDLKTISMHYFEEDDMKHGFLTHSKNSILRVDPENRCAAILVYSQNIIIIPFRKDAVMEDTDSSLFINSSSNNFSTSTKKSPVLPSYKLELPSEQYGANIINIVDIQFLYNYYEPTLLILYEPVRTWSGRIAVRQDTVHMMTLSLDVHQRVHPHIWSINHLPFNTFAALPVPKPVGGVLILANNALIHLNQGLPPYGISLNSFNRSNTSFPLKTYDGLTISLAGCQACFISNNKILLSLCTGDLYLLNLHNDTTRSLRTFNFIHLASSVICTTLTKCEEGFLFLGSRLSHSVLLYFYEKDKSKSEAANEKSTLNSNQALAKLIASPGFDETISEDEWLYGAEFCALQKRIKLEQVERVKPTVVLPENKEEEQQQPSEEQQQNSTEASSVEEKPEEKEQVDAVKVNGDDDAEKPSKEPTNDDEEAVEEAVPMETETEEQQMVVSATDHLLRVYESAEKEQCLLVLCDTLFNLSPCISSCLGEPNFSCDSWANVQDFEVELITAGGYEQAGALNILQRTIKPQIETSFHLPGCSDAWTVYGPTNYADEEAQRQQHQQQPHEFLILNQEEATIVFQVGQEINELEQSGFITQSSTVFTGNLGANKYILQVCSHSVRLLDSTHELQHFPLDLGSPIVHTSLADPYAVLMTANGQQVLLLCLIIDSKNGSARLVVSKPDLSTARSKITALCVYKDVSGLFSTENTSSKTAAESNGGGVKTRKSAAKSGGKAATKTPSLASTLSNLNCASTADEEDELLYSDSTVCFLGPDEANAEKDNSAGKDEEEEEEEGGAKDLKLTTMAAQEPTFWLFFVRQNGVLEIYTLPDFKLVYLVKNFPLGLRVLVDSIQTTDHSFHNSQVDASSMPITLEILALGMGLNQTRPFLFARFEEELFIYEAFAFFESLVDNHLKLRFRRHLAHNTLLHYPQLGLSKEEYESTFGGKPRPLTSSWLRPFSNIGGYAGVFLCGHFPCWFLMTPRGELRAHSMEVDGVVTSFAMFNNISCPNGFLYFNEEEELRFSVLPSQFDLDGHWPTRHVHIGRTVRFVGYHVESKTYALVMSRQVKVERIVRVGGEEKDYDPVEAGTGYIHATTEQFELQLVSPVSWEFIPGTAIPLEEWEHVTCMKNVLLSSEGTSSGLKGYVAMGTNYNYGEDVTNRGRIWILDIIEVVPEPGKPLTKNKIKTTYCKDQKGPVTALCQVKGYLLSAIGQKIYIWQLKESDLIGIAFIDAQIYVHTAISLRNLILIADVHKSISLLRYQEETRTLSLVSRDQKQLQVFSCEYMIDNSQMSFVVSDTSKNLIIYSYQPDMLESLGGTKLLRRADFHFGANVNSFFRIRCSLPSKRMDSRLKQTYLRRHITMFSTLNGTLGYLLPISEKTYRRLLMLQNLLTTNLQHIAGLNPKAYRMIRMQRLDLCNPSKNILDGDLLFKYFNLSMNEKVELARKIGTSIKQVCSSLYFNLYPFSKCYVYITQVVDDLQEIQCISSHF